MMVAVRALGQPVKRFQRSFPSCFSSNFSQCPTTSAVMPWIDVCTLPPVAWRREQQKRRPDQTAAQKSDSTRTGNHA